MSSASAAPRHLRTHRSCTTDQVCEVCPKDWLSRQTTYCLLAELIIVLLLEFRREVGVSKQVALQLHKSLMYVVIAY